MTTYKQFLEFIHKNYKSFLFVVFFYSLWLAYKYAITADTTLLSFPGRMIGEATLNAYDISKRIKTFYYTGAIFFLSVLFFLVILWIASRYSERFLKSPELKIFNYTSIAGITFYFFNLWTQSFGSSFELIFCIHKIALVGFTLKWMLLKNKSASELIDTPFYSISFVLGVSVFFILTEASILFDFFPKADLLIVIFVSSVLMTVATIFAVNNREQKNVEALLNRFAFLLVPFAWIPLLSFFKDEIPLILIRHEISFFGPQKVYFLFLLIIVGLIYWRYKRYKKSSSLTTNEELIAKRYFPLLVLSLSVFTFYQPIIDMSNEMFESGNQLLPIMEFQKFGVVPVFEKFNSHNLSEIFFGGIYTFFNGLHTREIYIYEFLLRVFWAIMVYLFVSRLSKNAYIALFAIFFFPLIDYLLLDTIIISLLALYATDKVIREQQSFKNYFLLFACLAFLLLWRIDVGYPSLLASLVIVLTYQINHETFKINLKLFFKTAFVFSGILVLILLIIGWFREINVFSKLWNGLNYLTSSQSYGVSKIGDESLSVYKIEYIVFPLVILLGIGALLVFFKKFNVSIPQSFVYTSFLFLAIYYIVNFQRGLVRHGFNEGGDARFASYSFFLFSACVFLVFQHKSSVFKLLTFIGISIFLLMNYKFPAQTEFNNVYSKMTEKVDSYSATAIYPNMSRCTDTMHYEEKYFGEIKEFMLSNMSEKQTFIDFANLPMLYYFTEKISPSYFYQNPLSVHNDYLQDVFVNQLAEYDAPLLVFSNFPKNWWDNVDGVPNTLRHYKMAEHFYQHYKPFGIIDNLCIWKRNDFNIENKQTLLFSYSRQADSSKSEGAIQYNLNKSTDKKYLLEIEYKKTAPEIRIKNASVEKIIVASFDNDVAHLAYYILSDSIKSESIIIDKSENVERVKLKASEIIPDFYSEYSQTQHIQQLPSIWGTYDSTERNVLVNLCSSPIKFSDVGVTVFDFNSKTIDKSKGNTILVTLEANNEDVSFLFLKFGGNAVGKLGEFIFKVMPGKGERKFAVRVSSQYNWYNPKVNYISIDSWPYNEVVLKKVEVLNAE